jgi:hypothetical protein
VSEDARCFVCGERADHLTCAAARRPRRQGTDVGTARLGGDADTFPPNRRGYPTSSERNHGALGRVVNHLTRTAIVPPSVK